MPVYTVHAPVAGLREGRPATDKFAFVRDGFSFWAFVGGGFWLLYHRLWLALLGYVVLTTAATTVLSLLHAGSIAEFTVMVLIALLMGIEAASLRRWKFSGRKWRQLDVVVADDEEAAERRFFDRWTAGRREGAIEPPPFVDRGEPPPTRPAYAPPQPHTEIVGLFPQPGASG